MNNKKFLWVYLFTLILGFASCEEDIDTPDENSECPKLSFKQDGENLIADFDGLKDLEVYEWFVDDQLVETESILNDNQRDNMLNLKDYNPGTYNVCIKAETPDCAQGTEFCKEIVIEDTTTGESCPTLKYEQDGDYLIANFEGVETIAFYAWQVTGEQLDNETIIENEGVDFQGDNKFSLKDLKPGMYTICLISESPTCTQAEPFCKDIEVKNDNSNESCPELKFIVEGTILFANFSGIDQLGVYEWFVDGQSVEIEDLQNQDRDDSFDLSGYNPGTYSVCIKAETADCPNGVEFCVDVVVPEPQQIDCTKFDLINSRDKVVGVNKPTITDIDPDSVVWTLDGNVITPITPRVARLKDHVTQDGTYEICYKSVSQTCGVLEKCVQVNYKQ